MKQGDSEAVRLDLSKSLSGRIYAGLSWDDSYHPNSRINKSSRLLLKFEDIPKNYLLILFVIFLFFYSWGFSLVLPLLELDPAPFFWIAPVIAFGSALLLSLFVMKLEGPDNTFSRKTEDLPERDKNYRHFDIDLHCFAYDKNKNYLFEVSPENRKLVSPDGKIYHSGEEETGIGVYDDETIHIEIKKLPDHYSYFVFSVSNDCAHSFKKISNLKVRLVDSASEKTIAEASISSDAADGFAFCSVHRANDEWFFSPINQYIKFDKEWKTSLTQFLMD